MESGYKIFWTDHALNELAHTFDYLETHFTERESRNLAAEIDKILTLISRDPHIFPESETKGVRRTVIFKFNTLYYREKEHIIEIISFFSNRQDPDSLKL